MREVFQTPGGAVRLDIRLPEGDVDVETAETQETIVELTGLPQEELLEIAQVHCRERGGAYEVSVDVRDQGWGRFWRGGRHLRLEARVPDGTELRVRSGTADVHGRGRFGAAAVETGSGDIELGDVDGDAVVKSASGDVRLGSVVADAVVSTASGDIEIDRVGGSSQVRSASGDVHIRDATSGVTAQTASGDLQIDAVTEGEVTLQSASGDMRVGIRRGSRVWVDARSMSGDTSSELELGDEVVDDDGPLVELRATAMSGDITVVRA